MAGRIPEEIIDEVRRRSDIADVVGEHVQLKSRGREFWACCPFHKEKTPSFKVSSEYQSYHCFGCGESGNVFSFVEKLEGLDFPGAVRFLARRAGVVIPEPSEREAGEAKAKQSRQERLQGVLQNAAQWFASQLKSPEGAKAREYLASREIPDAVTAEFGLGYAGDGWDVVTRWGAKREYDQEILAAAGLLTKNEEGHVYDRFRVRLMFPIHDHLGRVVGFSGRTLDPHAKTAKYINTPETDLFHKSRLLYGLHRARRAFRERGYVLLCEGQIDVIACHRAGLTNAVAPQGTAFTEEQARLLKRFAKQVRFAFDADAAGQKAAVRSVTIALEFGLTPTVVAIPEGEDPDSLLRTRGADTLTTLVEGAVDGFEFLLESARASHPGDTPQTKTEIVNDLLPPLAALGDDPVRQAAQSTWLAEQVAVPENAVRDALVRYERKVAKQESRRTERREKPPVAGPAEPSPMMPFNSPAAPLGNVARAESMLLDLALRHGPIAHQLVERLPPDALSQAAVGRALNLVLAHTQQGEWTEAPEYLAHEQDLVCDQTVGRVLAKSEFFPELPDDAVESDKKKREAILEQATEDCLGALEEARAQHQIAEVAKQIRETTDQEALRALCADYQDLVRQTRGGATGG